MNKRFISINTKTSLSSIVLSFLLIFTHGLLISQKVDIPPGKDMNPAHMYTIWTGNEVSGYYIVNENRKLNDSLEYNLDILDLAFKIVNENHFIVHISSELLKVSCNGSRILILFNEKATKRMRGYYFNMNGTQVSQIMRDGEISKVDIYLKRIQLFNIPLTGFILENVNDAGIKQYEYVTNNGEKEWSIVSAELQVDGANINPDNFELFHSDSNIIVFSVQSKYFRIKPTGSKSNIYYKIFLASSGKELFTINCGLSDGYEWPIDFSVIGNKIEVTGEYYEFGGDSYTYFKKVRGIYKQDFDFLGDKIDEKFVSYEKDLTQKIINPEAAIDLDKKSIELYDIVHTQNGKYYVVAEYIYVKYVVNHTGKIADLRQREYITMELDSSFNLLQGNIFTKSAMPYLPTINYENFNNRDIYQRKNSDSRFQFTLFDKDGKTFTTLAFTCYFKNREYYADIVCFYLNRESEFNMTTLKYEPFNVNTYYLILPSKIGYAAYYIINTGRRTYDLNLGKFDF
ncbi:MAG: DUF6770 family protein [Saprospiraceae bacterium]